MMLFTVGCHEYNLPIGAPRSDRAVPCSPNQDGPYQRENRIYYSTNGVTWRLSQRDFRLNTFLLPAFIKHPWSGLYPGEYRYGYRVVLHADTLFIVGGKRWQVYLENFNPVLDRNGKLQYQGLDSMDIWVSKGMVDTSLLCTEMNDLTTKAMIDRMQADRRSKCTFLFASLPGGVLDDSELE
jgi:hypothetical protein